MPNRFNVMESQLPKNTKTTTTFRAKALLREVSAVNGYIPTMLGKDFKNYLHDVNSACLHESV